MKFIAVKKLQGKIRTETGLHIGGTGARLEIGGADNPVIKNPVTDEPYIPGSSLKGKIRSELEKRLGKFTKEGEPCGCAQNDCLICKIFGPHKRSQHTLGPTRILVRDAHLSEESRKKFKELMAAKGTSCFESKTENLVNRKTGAAQNPRHLERVVPGAEFDMELVLQLADVDNEQQMLDFLRDGLRAVQQTYLGGYGSRGCGKVTFVDLKYNGKPFNLEV